MSILQRAIREGILGDPDAAIHIGTPDLPNMRGQTLEIAVPVHGQEIDGAIAGAGVEEVLEPIEAVLGAGDGGAAEFDAVRFEGFDLRLPDLRGGDGVRGGAAGGAAPVGLVQEEHGGDIGAGRELRFDAVQEGGVGRRVRRGAP